MVKPSHDIGEFFSEFSVENKSEGEDEGRDEGNISDGDCLSNDIGSGLEVGVQGGERSFDIVKSSFVHVSVESSDSEDGE